MDMSTRCLSSGQRNNVVAPVCGHASTRPGRPTWRASRRSATEVELAGPHAGRGRCQEAADDGQLGGDAVGFVEAEGPHKLGPPHPPRPSPATSPRPRPTRPNALHQPHTRRRAQLLRLTRTSLATADEIIRTQAPVTTAPAPARIKPKNIVNSAIVEQREIRAVGRSGGDRRPGNRVRGSSRPDARCRGHWVL